MLRPIIVLLLALATFMSFPRAPVAVAGPQTQITAPIVINSDLGPGSQLNLTIQVRNVGPLPEDIDAWQVRLRLDPVILKITNLHPGPILHQIADDFGGNVLDTLQFNATEGTVDANELLDLSSPPNPQPVNAGWTGSVGDLLYVQAQVLATGVSNLTITQSQLNDIDGRSFTAVPTQGCFSPEVCNGVFANVPDLPFNLPPIALFTITPGTPTAGIPAVFNASRSLDRDDTIALYSWDFGDGTPVIHTIDQLLNHTYSQGGKSFTVTLNVTDSRGSSGTARNTVFVASLNLAPVALFTFSPESPTQSELVTFDASASYDPDDGIPPSPGSLFYKWNFGDGVIATQGKIVSHSYTLAGTFTVNLTVTDRHLLEAWNATQITVRQLPDHDVSVESIYIYPSSKLVSGQMAAVIVQIENSGTHDENVTVRAFFDFNLIGTANATVISRNYYYAYVRWETMNVPAGVYVLSASVELGLDAYPSDNALSDGNVTILPPPVFRLEPSRGPVGTKISIKATGLPPIPYYENRPITINFDDQTLGVANTNARSFEFTFNVPQAQAGSHLIKIYDYYANFRANIPFAVVDDRLLNVGLDIGTIYFQGDTATGIVEVLQNGHRVDPSSISATLVLPDGSVQNPPLKRVPGTTGLFRLEIPVVSKAALGTYTLDVEAKYQTDTTDSEGHAVKVFTVRTVWVSPGRVQTLSVLGSVSAVGILVAVAFKTGHLNVNKRRNNNSFAATERRENLPNPREAMGKIMLGLGR